MTPQEAAVILCDATKDTIGEDPTQLDRVASVANALWREAVSVTNARLAVARVVLIRYREGTP